MKIEELNELEGLTFDQLLLNYIKLRLESNKYKEVIDKIEKIRHDRTCAENQIDEIEEVLKEVI